MNLTAVYCYHKIIDENAVVGTYCLALISIDLSFSVSSKAKAKLGWEPEITVEEMCAEMVEADLKDAQRHAFLKAHGYDVPVATET